MQSANAHWPLTFILSNTSNASAGEDYQRSYDYGIPWRHAAIGILVVLGVIIEVSCDRG